MRPASARVARASRSGRARYQTITGSAASAAYCGVMANITSAAFDATNVVPAAIPARCEPVHARDTTCVAVAVSAMFTSSAPFSASVGLSVTRKIGAKTGSRPNPGVP